MNRRELLDQRHKYDDPRHNGCKAMCRRCKQVFLWGDMFRIHGLWICGSCWYGKQPV